MTFVILLHAPATDPCTRPDALAAVARTARALPDPDQHTLAQLIARRGTPDEAVAGVQITDREAFAAAYPRTCGSRRTALLDATSTDTLVGLLRVEDDAHSTVATTRPLDPSIVGNLAVRLGTIDDPPARARAAMTVLDHPDATPAALRLAVHCLVTQHGPDLSRDDLERTVTAVCHEPAAALVHLQQVATRPFAEALAPYAQAARTGDADPGALRVRHLTRRAEAVGTAEAWATAVTRSASPAVAQTALERFPCPDVDVPTPQWHDHHTVARAVYLCRRLRGTPVHDSVTRPRLPVATPQERRAAASSPAWTVAARTSQLRENATADDIDICLAALRHPRGADSNDPYGDWHRAAHVLRTTTHPAATPGQRAALSAYLAHHPLERPDGDDPVLRDVARLMGTIETLVHTQHLEHALWHEIPVPALIGLSNPYIEWTLRPRLTRLWNTEPATAATMAAFAPAFAGTLSELRLRAHAALAGQGLLPAQATAADVDEPVVHTG